MTYRIESDHPLTSDWMPASACTANDADFAVAAATAIEGVEDPANQDVRVVCVETGKVIWHTIDEEYEGNEAADLEGFR